MPDPAVENITYEEELKHLAGFIPVLVKDETIPGTNQQEVIINWPDANLFRYPRIVKCLETYTFPTNVKPQKYVVNPCVQGGKKEGKIPGIWRLVSVATNKKDMPFMFLRVVG